MVELTPNSDGWIFLPTPQSVRALKSGDGATVSFAVTFDGAALNDVRVELSRDKATTLLGELKKALT